MSGQNILKWLQDFCKPTNLCKCGCGKATSGKGSDYYYGHSPNPSSQKSYWHEQAWWKFGKDNCEVCGISDTKHRRKHRSRLSMHNTLMPKDYTCMKAEAWMCVCARCHVFLEREVSKSS